MIPAVAAAAPVMRPLKFSESLSGQAGTMFFPGLCAARFTGGFE
jgi:hypothetical protein